MHNIGRVYFYPIKFSKRLRTLWLIKVQTTENLQNQKRKFEKFLPNSKSNKTFQILTIYRKRLESELILYRKYSNISSKIRFWNIERRGCKRPRVFHRDSGDGRGDQAALSRSSTRGESRLRWKSSSRSLSGRINPASINARPRSAERAYHRCCQHQRRVVAPAKSLDVRKHEPPAVSSISSSVSGSLRSRPPPRRSSDASPSLAPHPTSFLSSSPGFGRCFALNIWIPRIEEPRGTAGYTERHVFLSSSRSPRFAPPPSLLSLLSLSLSFFFLGLLSSFDSRWRIFFFGKFRFNGNDLLPDGWRISLHVLEDMDSKERFNITLSLFVLDSICFGCWRGRISTFLESLDYDISLSSSIRLIVHPRNYIYPEGILDFSEGIFWNLIYFVPVE